MVCSILKFGTGHNFSFSEKDHGLLRPSGDHRNCPLNISHLNPPPPPILDAVLPSRVLRVDIPFEYEMVYIFYCFPLTLSVKTECNGPCTLECHCLVPQCDTTGVELHCHCPTFSPAASVNVG